MEKQEKKLLKLNTEANECLTREDAQKIISKAKKAHAKLLVKKLIDDE